MLGAGRVRAAASPKRRGLFAIMVLAPVCIELFSMQARAQDVCGDIASSRATRSAAALVELADCYQASGQAVRALDALSSALDVAGGGPEAAPATITIRGRLGQAYASIGDHQSALDNLMQGIATADAFDLTAEAAPLLNDLGRMYMSTEEPLQGLAAFADSHRLAGESQWLRLTAAINLVRALGEAAPDAPLVGRLDEIRAEALTLTPSPMKAAMLLSLAELYGDLAPGPSGPSRPQRHAAVAHELATAALEVAQELDDPRLISNAYGQLGAAYADLGASDDALAMTRQAVLVAQQAGTDDSLYRWEWQAARLLRERENETGALAAYRAAIDTLASTEAWMVTSQRGFLKDVLPLYEEYADMMLARTRRLSAGDVKSALSEVQQTLEQLRIAEVRNYFENQCSVPEVFDAAREQPQDVVVIYPMLFADRSELLVRTRNRLSQFTADVGLEELTNEVRLLRESIQDVESGDAYLEHARQLHRWLIEPVEPVLEEASATTLVFVPDGPLRTIPMAVLHDGERFLVERYALGTTPGLSLIGAVNAEPLPRVLVNGIIAPVRDFPGLPFVAEEIESIGDTLPARVYADDAFVTATLEREILDGGYSIVHMATHGRFESDYRRSFLLAYDDLITMDQLEDFMGSQRFTDRPVDLLVLSACQTAVGDERAALGLAGVAVKAGARSALASLWFINDESTSQLIAEFYRQLAEPANSKADALRGAQLLLMNDEQHRHPAYWAPFLMIGDWR